jgi:cell division protein FtsI/penicillin-binding protein 2
VVSANLKGEEYYAQAMQNRTVLVRTMAPRGAIIDRRGKTLVTNNARFTVFVSPPDLPKDKAEREAVLVRAAELAKISREDIENERRKNTNKTMPFAIAENVDKYTLAKMAENRRLLPGIYVNTEPVRQYNEKKMASHVLGYIRQVSERDLKDKQITERGYVGGTLSARTAWNAPTTSFSTARRAALSGSGCQASPRSAIGRKRANRRTNASLDLRLRCAEGSGAGVRTAARRGGRP